MSDTKYFSELKLLSPPTKRAAYSDRTAYVCAELARLAYFPFEGGSTLERLMEEVNKALIHESVDEAVIGAIKSRLSIGLSQDKLDAASSRQAFEKTLKIGGFELVDTFVTGDTEGFVCRRDAVDGDGTAFLVYRGTESVPDALDDLNAFLTKEPFKDTDDKDSEVHRGFWGQFRDADPKVKELLKRVEGHQLFITGHSLGGALAVLATRFYAKNTSGSCYTFGAPAVGNPAFQHCIKTPIYRIVNEVDPVARVPSALTGFLVQFLYHWLHKLLILFGVKRSNDADRLIRDLKQYRQNGYASYLVPSNNMMSLRAGSSLDFIDRARFWFGRFQSKKKLLKLGDFHKMDNYVARLKSWAKYRNPD